MNVRRCTYEDECVKRISRSCGSASVARTYAYLRRAAYYSKEPVCEVIDEAGFYFGCFAKSHFRLVAIAVDKQHQGSGLGSALLNRICELCAEHKVDKLTFNCSVDEGAAGFYIVHGARIIGVDWKRQEYKMELLLDEYIK